MAAPAFWDDPKLAKEVSQRRVRLLEMLTNMTELDEAAEEFLAVLVEIAAQEEALVVMGADLAHIGPQFGQSQPVSRSDLVRLKEQDLALLDRAAEGDAAGFYASVAAERDRRNICGLAPIYAGLRIMGPVKGRLLGWDAWLDEKGRGSVSFAALAFERI